MKERLTGAIILVALIVLLVPELLTGPIRTKSAPGVSPTIVTEPPPAVRGGPAAHAEPPLRTYTLTLGAAPPAAGTPAPPPAQPPAQAASSAAGPGQSPAKDPAQGPTESDGPQHAQAPQPVAPHADAPRVPPRSTAAHPSLQVTESAAHPVEREARSSASSGGWVVQLGSFASRENADRLARSLAGRGFHMSVSPAHGRSRVLWRVRAGPARDRAGAARLAARLRALGHRGELLPVR